MKKIIQITGEPEAVKESFAKQLSEKYHFPLENIHVVDLNDAVAGNQADTLNAVLYTSAETLEKSEKMIPTALRINVSDPRVLKLNKFLERFDRFVDGFQEPERDESMRLLFSLDKKNYTDDDPRFVRPSVRGIIIRGGKIAMVHSLLYDYYKFPGGGIDEGETQIETLKREVAEEAGLKVIPESIRPFGRVFRAEKSQYADVLIQENYYYLCDAEDGVNAQELDDYEAEEHFTLEWVEPEVAIKTNRRKNYGPKSRIMIEREARVLEILIEEGYFN